MKQLLGILLFFSLTSAFGQDNALLKLEAERAWERGFYQSMRFPREALRSKTGGYVSLALKFDSTGAIDSYRLDQEVKAFFNKEVLKGFEAAQKNWNPIIVDDKDLNQEYLLVFSFEMLSEEKESNKNRAIRYVQKNKPEKAFKIVNRLVQDYPFDQEFLRFRSQIHRQLGQEQEATADLLKAQNLESSIISSLSFKVFGVTSTRQISGKTF
ncbi:MAG TPA: hypothetical protein DEP37_09805 [Algoriphagus sp.]|nr:hypothetical protein [Algoriphagus sp.]